MRILLVSCLVLGLCSARPQQSSLVVTTTTVATTIGPTVGTTGRPDLLSRPTKVPTVEEKEDLPKPIVDKLHIKSDIQFRYSKTVVESRIKNPSISNAQDVEFEMVLPEKAFISNFTIATEGQTYVSKVERKENATQIFNEAVSSGQTAGLVDAREGNVFAIKTNVAAAEKLTFTLTYEQLLERRLSKYEQVINVNPGQIVKDMEINVFINESLPVVNVNVPELKQKSNELIEDLAKNPVAIISEDLNIVNITYKPTVSEQRELNAEGVNGQFIIHYDVDRKNQSSDIQVHDGYLVHFFVPENVLEVLPKHVTFVLDTSGSMSGEKITQLQDAMVTILSDLKPKDHFSILEFDSIVTPWLSPADLESQLPLKSQIPPLDLLKEPVELEKPRPIYQANEFLVEQAIEYAVGLEASGGTNINDALLEAIEVAKKGKSDLPENTTPLIIFLTDGQPSSGVTNREDIKKNLKKSNEAGIPVYGLAFGAGADFGLVKDLSDDNRAFARKIFEGSDATIQLENFYAEISSPLLNNVTFEYVGEDLEATENVLPGSTFNSGSEFISVVKLSSEKKLPSSVKVSGLSIDRHFEDVIRPCLRVDDKDTTSPTDLVPVTRPTGLIYPFPCIPFPEIKIRPVNFIERLWAHLTIEKLLDDKADNKELTEAERKEEATDIALKYNFVTDLTSLVVVKPSANKTGSDKSLAKITPVSQQGLPHFHASGFSAQRFVPVSSSFALATSFSSLGGTNLRSGSPSRRKSRPSPNIPFPKIGSLPPNSIQDSLQGAPPPTFFPTTTIPTTTTTTYVCIPADCQIELFSRTLLRGKNVTITTDTKNLADFDNKVESLKVSGNCQWRVWTETDFKGAEQSFTTGEFKNARTIKNVLRKASSVENIGCI